jgi:hypothetical protein
VFYFSGDLVALDTMDFWVGTFCIFLLALLQALIFGWVFGIRRGIEEARRGARLGLPRSFGFIVRFVVPAYLLGVMVGFLVQELPAHVAKLLDVRVARNTTLLIAGVWGGLLLATSIAVRRWQRLGLTGATHKNGGPP